MNVQLSTSFLKLLEAFKKSQTISPNTLYFDILRNYPLWNLKKLFQIDPRYREFWSETRALTLTLNALIIVFDRGITFVVGIVVLVVRIFFVVLGKEARNKLYRFIIVPGWKFGSGDRCRRGNVSVAPFWISVKLGAENTATLTVRLFDYIKALICALLGIVEGAKALLAFSEVYSSHGVWVHAA